MLGSRSGLATRFENFTQKKIYKIYCLAHHLDLAIRHAFESEH